MVASLRKYIGIPYQSGGRSRTSVDCWGLCRLFYENELGITVPSYLDYEDAADAPGVAEVTRRRKREWVSVTEPQFGDILLFNILGWPAHTGIFIDRKNFLHSLQGCNSAIERLNSITWNKRLAGIYRWHKK